MWHQPLIQGKVKEDFNCELAELRLLMPHGEGFYTQFLVMSPQALKQP